MMQGYEIVVEHADTLASIREAYFGGHLNEEEATALREEASELANTRLDEYFDAKYKAEIDSLPFLERWFNRICDRFGWLQ